MPKLFGSASNQLPQPNQLGSLAYQDGKSVAIDGGAITATTNVVNGGFYQDTDTSDVRPTVTMDFVNGKTIDNRFYFNRPSTLWRDLALPIITGNNASYYDGLTNEIYEENVAWYSEIPYHTNELTTTLQSTQAPDGVSWAYTVTETANNSHHSMYRGNYYNDAQTRQQVYTASIYAKFIAGGAQYLYITLYYTTNQYATVKFDISGGTITLRRQRAYAKILDATITNVGNSWYRCSVSGFSRSEYGIQTYFGLSSDATTLDTNSAGLHTYAGNTSKSMYWWGTQIEMRSSLGEYVPTHQYGVSRSVPVLAKAIDNQPRFDHNPATMESLGLLIENAATNLIKNSEPNPTSTLFATHWQVSNAVSRLQSRGGINGILILPNSSYSSVSPWSQSIACLLNLQIGVAVNTSANYRWSFYINPLTWTGDIRFAVVSGDGNTSFGTNLLLFNNGQYVGDSSYVKYVLPDGTYVLTNMPNTYNTGESLRPIWYTTTTGNAWRKWWVSAIQYEAGQTSTSYISTYSREVRRSPDLLLSAQRNLLSYLNNEQGTVVIEVSTYVPTYYQSSFFFELGDGGYHNQIQLYFNSNTGITMFVAGSGNSESVAVGNHLHTTLNGTNFNKTRIRVALGYRAEGGLSISVNGQPIYYLTTPLMRYSHMFVGVYGDNSWPQTENSIQGWVRDFVYYPAKLSDAELQELSML